MENVKYLYHLTTDDGLKQILKDMKIKPFHFKSVFFGSCVEDCLYLSPAGGAERFNKVYWDKMYSKYKNNSALNNRYTWVEMRKVFPVLKISVEWIGVIVKQKTLGHYEYLHSGEVRLKETPEIIYAQIQPYKMLTRK